MMDPGGCYRVDCDSEEKELHDVIDKTYSIGLSLHEKAKPSFSPEEVSEIYSSIYGEPIPHQRLEFRTLVQLFEENQHRFAFCEETKGFKCRPVETPRSAVQEKKTEEEDQDRQEEEPRSEEKDQRLEEKEAGLKEGERRASKEPSESSYDSDESIRALQIAVKKRQQTAPVFDRFPPRFEVGPLRRVSVSPEPRRRRRLSTNNCRLRSSSMRRTRSRSRSRFTGSSPSSSPRPRKRRNSSTSSPRRNKSRRSRSSGRSTNSSPSSSPRPRKRRSSSTSSPRRNKYRRSRSSGTSTDSSRSHSPESRSPSSSPKLWPRKSGGSESSTQPSSPMSKRRSCSPLAKRYCQSTIREQIQKTPTASSSASMFTFEAAKSLFRSAASSLIEKIVTCLEMSAVPMHLSEMISLFESVHRQDFKMCCRIHLGERRDYFPILVEYSAGKFSLTKNEHGQWLFKKLPGGERPGGLNKKAPADDVIRTVIAPTCPPKQTNPPKSFWKHNMIIPPPPLPPDLSLRLVDSTTRTVSSTQKTASFAMKACPLPFLPPPSISWTRERPPIPQMLNAQCLLPPPPPFAACRNDSAALPPMPRRLDSTLSMRYHLPSPPPTPPPRGPLTREGLIAPGLSTLHPNGQLYPIPPPGIPWPMHPPQPSFMTPFHKKAAFENFSQKVRGVLASMHGHAPFDTVKSVYYKKFGSSLQNDFFSLVPYESPLEILNQISCGEIVVFRSRTGSIFLQLKNVR